jgi:hypothetical protein
VFGHICNLAVVTDIAEDARRPRIVVLAQLPAEPVRHRMALWRELRRSGAIPLGQAVWALDLVEYQTPLARQ